MKEKAQINVSKSELNLRIHFYIYYYNFLLYLLIIKIFFQATFVKYLLFFPYCIFSKKKII